MMTKTQGKAIRILWSLGYIEKEPFSIMAFNFADVSTATDREFTPGMLTSLIKGGYVVRGELDRTFTYSSTKWYAHRTAEGIITTDYEYRILNHTPHEYESWYQTRGWKLDD